jgi:hypothetical protein
MMHERSDRIDCSDDNPVIEVWEPASTFGNVN